MTNSVFSARSSGILDRIGPGLRKIIENMGWLVFDRIVRMGMGLFVGVWVARYLGPIQFGSFNFAFSFLALFGTLSTLGLDALVIREAIRCPPDVPEILGTTLALRSGGALCAFLISVAAIHLIQPNDQIALQLVVILGSATIFTAFDTIDSYFQSQVQSKITVWAKNSAFLVFAVVKVLLIETKAPLLAFAVASVGEAALGAVGLLLGYRWTGGRILAWTVSKKRAIELLKQSWPVILSGMAIMVYMRIDMVMLKVMQGDAAVGVYAAATRVSEVWYFIPMAIVSSVSPAIMRAKDRPAIYYGRIRNLCSMMTMTACVIGFAVAPASHMIIRLLYSNTYSAAGPVLAVHIWASVFVFLGMAQSPWNISENLLKLSLYWTVAGAIGNVVMNVFLIPRYSAMGAAIATVVSYAISGVFANALSSRTRPIFYLQMKSFIPTQFWKQPESDGKQF